MPAAAVHRARAVSKVNSITRPAAGGGRVSGRGDRVQEHCGVAAAEFGEDLVEPGVSEVAAVVVGSQYEPVGVQLVQRPADSGRGGVRGAQGQVGQQAGRGRGGRRRSRPLDRSRGGRCRRPGRRGPSRSDLAGWAQYGYCASHSRYFWGLRLHLVCTLGGLPIAFALTGAKADERGTLLDIFATEPKLASSRPGQTLIGDKNYFGRDFEAQLADIHIELLRPARKGEAERAGSKLFKPLRQVIESINEIFKGQLDLERHHGRTPGGVIVRVLQRLLAPTAAIWHNQHTGQPIMRSLTPYDH
jgi:hypothetical protein